MANEITISHEPPHECRRLVAGLHRNSQSVARLRFGFDGRNITLGANSQDIWQHDKLPVLAHHGRTTCVQEALLSTKSVLPIHGILGWNSATQLERYL